MSDNVKRGVVKFFNGSPGKNFGFIIPADGGENVFFHFNNYQPYDGGTSGPHREPRKGDELIYREEHAPRGVRAKKWAFAEEMTASVNEGPVGAIKLSEMETLYRSGLKPGDESVYYTEKFTFGFCYGGVGWTEVILRPSTGELFRFDCYDAEASNHEPYLKSRGRVPNGSLPDGITILDE